MASWFSSLWQKAKKPLEVFVIIVVLALVTALVVVIVRAYIFQVNVPSISDKHLWDWLQLLIIPAVLAAGGYLFTFTTSRNEQKATKLRDQTERDIAQDNQQEAALQEYIDRMSELLLERDLRKSGMDAEVRTIARVRTLTVLSRLNGERKGNVLRFLRESGLIIRGKSIIDLREADIMNVELVDADLSDTDLSGANFYEANLCCVNLENADLTETSFYGADMTGANLRRANLTEASLVLANLEGANLSEADLSGANLHDATLRVEVRAYRWLDGKMTPIKYGQITNLTGAKVTQEQLDQVYTLKGAIMPDGSIHA